MLLACALIVGCSDRGAGDLSVSATTEASSDGSVHVRKATAAEKDQLEKHRKIRQAIDERFPGAQAPIGAPSERVSEVSVPGIIKLESGTIVRLDGIRCAEEGVTYLRRMLQDSTTSVIIFPSGDLTSQPTPADVWMVDQLSSSQAYSNLAETAITSGWCNVEPTGTSKHKERYAALAEAFQHPPTAR